MIPLLGQDYRKITDGSMEIKKGKVPEAKRLVLKDTTGSGWYSSVE